MRLPKLSSGIVAAALGLLVTAWEGRPVHAEVTAEQSTVIARIGQQTITLADFNRRTAGIPPFQLKGFGRNAAEIKRNFLERVLVREALLAQGATDIKLDQREDVKERIRGVMRNIMREKVRSELLARPITDADIKAYYDKNATKFHSPPRVWLWRIEVAKREEALEVLAAMKKDPSSKRWNDMARERSLDKATAMRGGNLGFVAPDGTTAEPGLKVDKGILDAVAGVKDMDFAPDPIKVGERWDVVWKRQSTGAIDRAIDVEAASIRQVLTHERSIAHLKIALERYRIDGLTDYHPEMLDLLELGPSGDLQPLRRPGTMPLPRKTPAMPAPGADGR